MSMWIVKPLRRSRRQRERDSPWVKYNFVINCILATENHKFFYDNRESGSFFVLMDGIIMKFLVWLSVLSPI